MRRWSLLRILPAALILVGVVRDRTPSSLTWWSMTARGEIKNWVVGPWRRVSLTNGNDDVADRALPSPWIVQAGTGAVTSPEARKDGAVSAMRCAWLKRSGRREHARLLAHVYEKLLDYSSLHCVLTTEPHTHLLFTKLLLRVPLCLSCAVWRPQVPHLRGSSS